MTMHISYETAKALKAFLGESAPEPIEGGYWCGKGNAYSLTPPVKGPINSAPFFKLHDLLSKPFLQAFTAKRMDMQNSVIMLWPEVTGGYLYKQYIDDGLPAVENALCEMMGGK